MRDNVVIIVAGSSAVSPRREGIPVFGVCAAILHEWRSQQTPEDARE